MEVRIPISGLDNQGMIRQTRNAQMKPNVFISIRNIVDRDSKFHRREVKS